MGGKLVSTYNGIRWRATVPVKCLLLGDNFEICRSRSIPADISFDEFFFLWLPLFQQKLFQKQMVCFRNDTGRRKDKIL